MQDSVHECDDTIVVLTTTAEVSLRLTFFPRSCDLLFLGLKQLYHAP